MIKEWMLMLQKNLNVPRFYKSYKYAGLNVIICLKIYTNILQKLFKFDIHFSNGIIINLYSVNTG